MKSTIPVFVISLASSTDRRAGISERLKQLGMEFEFVDGIDLRNADISNHAEYDGARRRLFFGCDLQPGELGCLLSHRKVYQIIASRKLPHGLVLEDDAGLEDDLPDVLCMLTKSPVSWDFIRFLDKKKVYLKSCRRIGMIDASHELSRLPTNSGGAYGYLINQRAANRLLELTDKSWLQIDMLHSRTWLTRLTTYILRPSPVTHPVDSDDETLIGTMRYQKRNLLSGWKRAAHPFARFGMKLQDQLGKRIHYLKSASVDAEQRKKAHAAATFPSH